MGRRYYCDYCDKTFIDDIDARKKHINSALHQKIRNEHYQGCRGSWINHLINNIIQLTCI